MGKILFFVVIFLLVGGYMIKVANDYDLKDGSDKKDFLAKFIGWLKHIGKNMLDITGLVIEQDWLPDKNMTNSTKDAAGIPGGLAGGGR